MAGDERLEEEGELSVVVPRKPPYTLSRKNVKDSMDKFGISLNDINSEKVLQQQLQCPKVNGSNGNSTSSHHPHISHHLLPPSLPNTTTTSTTESLIKNHNSKKKKTTSLKNSDTLINQKTVTVIVCDDDVEETTVVLDEEADGGEDRVAGEGLGDRRRILGGGGDCDGDGGMAKCSSCEVDPDSMEHHLHHPLSRTNKLSRLNLQQTLAVLGSDGSVGASGGISVGVLLEDEDEVEEGDDENMDSDFDDEERPLSSLQMESNDNKEEKCASSRMRKNKRRTLRFHSSESSDR